MIALLAVLLFLTYIVSPGTYSTATIYSIEQQHQAQVDAVENDPVLYNQVKMDYTDEASRIILKDEIEN